MIHKISTILFLILGLTANNSAIAYNIYRAGDVIHGQEYNETLGRWIDRDFSIWVGVTDNNTEHLLFKAETGLSIATVIVDNTDQTREKLKEALSKSIEWSAVAKENKADVTKGLGCFGPDKYNLCEKDSTAFEKGQMSLKFFSANSGNQTNLIIYIIDQDNQFTKAIIYFTTSETEKLLEAVDGIDASLEKAKEAAKNNDLFK